MKIFRKSIPLYLSDKEKEILDKCRNEMSINAYFRKLLFADYDKKIRNELR